MITLITGLPGNGKTLYTISFVKALAEKENRPVFYSGITDLALDWTEIEPEKEGRQGFGKKTAENDLTY